MSVVRRQGQLPLGHWKSAFWKEHRVWRLGPHRHASCPDSLSLRDRRPDFWQSQCCLSLLGCKYRAGCCLIKKIKAVEGLEEDCLIRFEPKNRFHFAQFAILHLWLLLRVDADFARQKSASSRPHSANSGLHLLTEATLLKIEDDHQTNLPEQKYSL